MRFTKILTTMGASVMMAVSVPLSAMAASTVLVTPSNNQGWSEAYTTSGGTVSYVADADAPAGAGALRLTTDSTNAAKAQYMHATSTPLESVTELSYYTKQVSSPFAEAAASYQLPTYLNGGTAGFTTLVFEPYQNTNQGPVVAGEWQQWDVDQGLFWSSKTIVCENGTITGTAGGPATYTLADIMTKCPEADVAGFGVNIGSYNPSYNVLTDMVNFNGTTYNFESTKDACKKDEWKGFSFPFFKNQGDCVSHVNNGK